MHRCPRRKSDWRLRRSKRFSPQHSSLLAQSSELDAYTDRFVAKRKSPSDWRGIARERYCSRDVAARGAVLLRDVLEANVSRVPLVVSLALGYPNALLVSIRVTPMRARARRSPYLWEGRHKHGKCCSADHFSSGLGCGSKVGPLVIGPSNVHVRRSMHIRLPVCSKSHA